MRRLLLASLLLAAAAGAPPASAGPAVCVVTSGFPVCAGTCQRGESVGVTAIGGGGSASCGGATASCFDIVRCSASSTATGSGSLSCGGSAIVVICTVGSRAN